MFQEVAVNTIVLGPQDTGPPLETVIQQMGAGELQVCDESGKVLAYVTSATSRGDKLYAEAEAAFMAQRETIERRLKTRGGITTEELCRRVGMPYHGKILETE
jgi:hypothetical protein